MDEMTKKYLFDLKNGDRFLWNGHTLEVVSCFGYQGLPYGFDRIGNTSSCEDNVVYCVEPVDGLRSYILPFENNHVVMAF